MHNQYIRSLTPKAPRVLNADFEQRLANANDAMRQLRAMGLSILHYEVPWASNQISEIWIDRNPGFRLDYAGIHVGVSRRAA